MSGRVIGAIADLVGPRHYAALLICTMSLTVIAPLVDHYVGARVVVGGLVILCLLTASLAANRQGHVAVRSAFIAMLSAVMWTMAFSYNVAPFNTVYFGIASYAVTLLFFVTVCSVMWQDIFSGVVTANRICGAVCIYIIIGFCFAILHMMVVLADPSAYKVTAGPDALPTASEPLSAEKRYPLFVYFSFCTLSTLGYGDMVPVSRLARAICCVEGVTGQLYLAILVARLVGLHVANGMGDNLTTPRNTSTMREFQASRRR